MERREEAQPRASPFCSATIPNQAPSPKATTTSTKPHPQPLSRPATPLSTTITITNTHKPQPQHHHFKPTETTFNSPCHRQELPPRPSQPPSTTPKLDPSQPPCLTPPSSPFGCHHRATLKHLSPCQPRAHLLLSASLQPRRSSPLSRPPPSLPP